MNRAREAEAAIEREGLAIAVAKAYFKLLAYKDEYEVARLYSDGDFERRLHDQFEGDFKITFHLAPPLFARPHPETGEPRKIRFGPWIQTVFRALAPLRFLRGTPFDPFGHGADRKRERWLIAEYERVLDELLDGLMCENHGLAIEIASLPERIRGFGHVKEAAMMDAKRREAELLANFRNAGRYVSAAE